MIQQGATHCYDHDGLILYYFKSSYGYHQTKNNVIEFKTSSPDLLVKL